MQVASDLAPGTGIRNRNEVQSIATAALLRSVWEKKGGMNKRRQRQLRTLSSGGEKMRRWRETFRGVRADPIDRFRRGQFTSAAMPAGSAAKQAARINLLLESAKPNREL